MLIVSFCHAYNNEIEAAQATAPAIVCVDKESFEMKDVVKLFFPRNPADFLTTEFSSILRGDKPDADAALAFKHLPRFGVTGLAVDEGLLYCATWNGIYVLDQKLKPVRFLTNRLMSDLHGIDVVGDNVYSLSPALDMVVVTHKQTGEAIDYMQVNNKLQVSKNPEVLKFDWRFISKQRRGAVGLWHFNNVSLVDEKMYVNSRLFSCLLEIDSNLGVALMRSFNWDTPVMLHDGIPLASGGFGFTSVDGKIIEANNPDKLDSSMKGMEIEGFHPLMSHDMNTSTIRLHKWLGREANWCRGLHEDVDANSWYTTIDGRYDQDRPYFQIMRIGRGRDDDYQLLKVGYESCEFPNDVRYMTGFDLCDFTAG